MKKIVFFILLLTLSFRLTAQIDYLEPVKPFTTYTGELCEYYRNVFSLLNTGFQQQPYARFVAIPSFSPEYAMSVEIRVGVIVWFRTHCRVPIGKQRKEQ